ncbi:Protein of unknown function [Micrococcales bacterium KH10]|nr:Protein of unknown function [Micrococcales bacterium KH10]
MVSMSQTATGTHPNTDGELSDRDRAILHFERGWWRFAGAKEQAISTEFSMSPTQYYQVLNRLIDTEAALAAEPLLVKRLRRLRDQRQRERSDGRRRQG